MKAKQLLYTAIILFPFFSAHKAQAQNRERHRSVTINQTVVDGKVVASDTIITYTDTTTRTINSKEVSMEMPFTKGGTVYINNSYRKLNIKQSKDGKVRLVTTTFFYGEPTFTNEQWLEKLNIQMKNTDSGISIMSGGIGSRNNSSAFSWDNSSNQTDAQKFTQLFSSLVPNTPAPPAPSGTTITNNGARTEVRNGKTTTVTNGASREVRINGTGTVNGTAAIGSIPATETVINGWNQGNTYESFRGLSSSIGSSTAVFDEKGNNVYNSSSLRRELTLYIPADANLNVVCKYADVNADHDLKNLKIRVSNGSLDMVNADNATIISTYSNISAGNITNADISATTGKLSLKNADQLTLNTKYAKVEIDNCNTLTLKSTSDDYDLDVVKNISGTQNYGKIRLNKLTGSFDLKGSSGDVKIRNIEPSVSAVTLDNKYADVRFPVSSLKNYEVLFSGNYNSVFASFEKKDTTIENKQRQVVFTSPTDGVTSSANTMLYRGSSRSSNQAFTAAVGDTKGTHTIFKLVCNSCNVDFK